MIYTASNFYHLDDEAKIGYLGDQDLDFETLRVSSISPPALANIHSAFNTDSYSFTVDDEERQVKKIMPGYYTVKSLLKAMLSGLDKYGINITQSDSGIVCLHAKSGKVVFDDCPLLNEILGFDEGGLQIPTDIHIGDRPINIYPFRYLLLDCGAKCVRYGGDKGASYIVPVSNADFGRDSTRPFTLDSYYVYKEGKTSELNPKLSVMTTGGRVCLVPLTTEKPCGIICVLDD